MMVLSVCTTSRTVRSEKPNFSNASYPVCTIGPRRSFVVNVKPSNSLMANPANEWRTMPHFDKPLKTFGVFSSDRFLERSELFA